jgi:hypothetical protein
MRSVRSRVLVCAVLFAGACTTESRHPFPDAAPPGGSGGAGGSGGSGGGFGAGGDGGTGGGGTGGSGGGGGTGGSAGSGGSGGIDAAPPDAPADAADDGGPADGGGADADIDGSTPDAGVDGSGDVAPAPDGGASDVVSDAGIGVSVLFVTGIAPAVASDITLIDRLTGRGYGVATQTDMAATAADLQGKTLILLSASTTLARVMTSLPNLPTLATPVVAMDENLEPFLNLTAAAASDHAATANQTQVAIIAGADPTFTAGLTGTVTVYNMPFAVGWGIPGPGALKVATIVNNAAHVALFAYPAGAEMANTQMAPAKRAFYFVRDNATPNVITDDALKLFDAVTDWASH